MINRTFVGRICAAVGKPRADLAKLLGVKESDLARLAKTERKELAGMDEDPMWTRLAEYVDKRIGLLLAVREELNRKLAEDRQKKLARRIAIVGRK